MSNSEKDPLDQNKDSREDFDRFDRLQNVDEIKNLDALDMQVEDREPDEESLLATRDNTSPKGSIDSEGNYVGKKIDPDNLTTISNNSNSANLEEIEQQEQESSQTTDPSTNTQASTFFVENTDNSEQNVDVIAQPNIAVNDLSDILEQPVDDTLPSSGLRADVENSIAENNASTSTETSNSATTETQNAPANTSVVSNTSGNILLQETPTISPPEITTSPPPIEIPPPVIVTPPPIVTPPIIAPPPIVTPPVIIPPDNLVQLPNGNYALVTGQGLSFTINSLSSVSSGDAFGYYFADSNGNPIYGVIIDTGATLEGDLNFMNYAAIDAPPETTITGYPNVINYAATDLPPGATQIGFFVIPDSVDYNSNSGLTEGSVINFVGSDQGSFVPVFNGNYLSGSNAPVIFSDSSLNSGGDQYYTGTDSSDDRIIVFSDIQNGQAYLTSNIDLTVYSGQTSSPGIAGPTGINSLIQGENGNFELVNGLGGSITISSLSSTADGDSFGYYFADANGKPISGVIYIADVTSNISGSMTISYSPSDVPSNATQIGFFIIPGGATQNPDLTNGTAVNFTGTDPGSFVASYYNTVTEMYTYVISSTDNQTLFSDASLNTSNANYMQSDISGNQFILSFDNTPPGTNSNLSVTIGGQTHAGNSSGVVTPTGFDGLILNPDGSFNLFPGEGITINLDSITSISSYSNSFGHFFVDSDGNILYGVVDIANINNTTGPLTINYSPSDIPADAAGIGFFIIPDGANPIYNNNLVDNSTIFFQSTEGGLQATYNGQFINGNGNSFITINDITQSVINNSPVLLTFSDGSVDGETPEVSFNLNIDTHSGATSAGYGIQNLDQDVNGSYELITGQGASFTITNLVSTSALGDSFGHYFVDSNGYPISGMIDIANVTNIPTSLTLTYALNYIPQGATGVNFFIIPNGSQNPGLTDGVTITFTGSDPGSFVAIYNGAYLNGTENGAQIIFSDPSLNLSSQGSGQIVGSLVSFQYAGNLSGANIEAATNNFGPSSPNVSYAGISDGLIGLPNGNYQIDPGSGLSIHADNFDSNSILGNSFGHYFADANGKPIYGVIDVANVTDSSGPVIINYAPSDIPPGATQIGFFIIPDGFNQNTLSDGAVINFTGSDSGSYVPIYDGDYLNGVNNTPVLFSDSSLNSGSASYQYAFPNNINQLSLNFQDTTPGDTNSSFTTNLSINTYAGVGSGIVAPDNANELLQMLNQNYTLAPNEGVAIVVNSVTAIGALQDSFGHYFADSNGNILSATIDIVDVTNSGASTTININPVDIPFGATQIGFFLLPDAANPANGNTINVGSIVDIVQIPNDGPPITQVIVDGNSITTNASTPITLSDTTSSYYNGMTTNLLEGNQVLSFPGDNGDIQINLNLDTYSGDPIEPPSNFSFFSIDPSGYQADNNIPVDDSSNWVDLTAGHNTTPTDDNSNWVSNVDSNTNPPVDPNQPLQGTPDSDNPTTDDPNLPFDPLNHNNNNGHG